MATLCTSCRLPIEPDDGGALWYHVDNMSMMCDGDESTDISRQASPPDDESRHGNVPDLDPRSTAVLAETLAELAMFEDGSPGADMTTRDAAQDVVERLYRTFGVRARYTAEGDLIDAHAGEDGDDLPPAPELDALERIREAVGTYRAGEGAGPNGQSAGDAALDYIHRILESIGR